MTTLVFWPVIIIQSKRSFNIYFHRFTLSFRDIEELLAEFNIHCSSRNVGIKSAVENLLEDFDNGFTCEFRAAINVAYGHLITQSEIIEQYN